MTYEVIVTVGGVPYKLTRDIPLTQEDINATIADIARQTGCSTCGARIQSSLNDRKIVNLAPTCTSASKQATGTVTLTAAPAGGKAPYTVSFYKGAPPPATTGTLLSSTPNVPENGGTTPPSYTYTLTGADTGTPEFSTYITDSCSPAQSNSQLCNVTVVTNICSYISNIGGKSAIKAANISALITNYATGSLGFYSRAVDIQGALLYYAGANGNTSTGCNF